MRRFPLILIASALLLASCCEKETPARPNPIPVIRLTTDDGQPVTSKTIYKAGAIAIEEADSTAFQAQMEIRGRGNSTWDPENIPKLPYKIRLKESARLFGMSDDRSWDLLANWSDKSLLRNRVCYELSKIVGMEWTPKSVPVEVYLNGDYIGLYDFIEHKSVSAERVNIDLKAGDIYFELESQMDSPVCWTTELGHPVNFKEPEHPNQTQIDYAKQFFKDFEDALAAKEYSRVYDEFIDVDSFIDNFIVEEFSKDVDGILRKSTFLTLKKGGKLQMYNLWDFDITFGNCDYYQDGLEPWEGWWVRTHNMWGPGRGWYWLMFQDKVFVDKVKQRWNEVYPEFVRLYKQIDVMAIELGDAPKRNFEKWPILTQYVWPNCKVTGSYKGEVDWLKENYRKRLEWMNTNIAKL